MEYREDFYQLRKIGRLTPTRQIILIVILYLATIWHQYLVNQPIGNIGPASTFSVSILFAPIYEEILFRGLLLGYFLRSYSKTSAFVGVSLMFGIWHVKNIFWYDSAFLLRQVSWTALVFSVVPG